MSWSSYHLSLIEPYDPPFRFLVNSFSKRDIYLVDLENYGGNGQCDCEHFKFNLEPKLARGADRSDNLRCKHILICRVFAGLDVLDMVIDNRRKMEKQCRRNGQDPNQRVDEEEIHG